MLTHWETTLGYRVKTAIACIMAPLLGLVAAGAIAIALHGLWRFFSTMGSGFVDVASLLGSAIVGTAIGILVTQKILGAYSPRPVFCAFVMLVALSICAAFMTAALRAQGNASAFIALLISVQNLTAMGQCILTILAAKLLLLDGGKPLFSA